MTETAIEVERLGKQYRIGARQRENSLRAVLAAGARRSVRRLLRGSAGGDGQPAEQDRIWALKDVSFEVRQGEVLGIIGRNGAGKSTLLKVLSRITRPTEGRAVTRGRVGSLLEVGTGFHTELTGRENVYLSGAILGMRKAEIDAKFDEIIAFADVETFVDTPVKRYSNGMFVRLAFAVAAHLEPEILMVDEVLAVGDIDFQKKCIGSMESVARSGRTVLVVSHNMGLIESLCTRALWLEEGRVQSGGRPSRIIDEYLTSSRAHASADLEERSRRTGHGTARFSSIQVVTAGGAERADVLAGSEITLKLGIRATEPLRQPWIGIDIRSHLNHLLFHIANREAGYELPPIQGDVTVTCRIRGLNLLPGRYYLDLDLRDMALKLYDEVPSAAHFDVQPADVLQSGMPLDDRYGVVFFPTAWEVSNTPAGDSADPQRPGR